MPNKFVRYTKTVWSLITLHLGTLLLIGLMIHWGRHLYQIQEIRNSAERVRVSLLEVESGQRGFLLTGNDLYLDNYRFHRLILHLRLESLCKKIPANPPNKDLCQQISKLIDLKLDEMEETIRLARSGHIRDSLALVRTDRGFQWMRQIDTKLAEIRTDNGTGNLSSGCLVSE